MARCAGALTPGCGFAAAGLWDRAKGAGQVRFRILGPLEVAGDDGVPVPVAGVKERALLADLLVNAGRVVAADRLIDDLWGEHAPGNPANALQGRVSQLRRALGPAGRELVAHRPPGYVLAIEPGAVDAAEFEALVTAASAAEPDRARALLTEALGLWRGPALAEFAAEPFAQAEAARLEELRLAATETRIELELAAGRHAELIGELEALVAAHPHRERPVGQLMLALYRSGRQAEALTAYSAARTVLADELGIDPSPELQRLHQAILVQDPALAAPTAHPPHNLPAQLTSFVGRDAELGEVAGLLTAHRLVTLTGPGGSGKTTLAIELAGRVLGRYRDGVWLADLTGITDPALLPGTVAAALGLGHEPGAPAFADRLALALRDRELLLVLDNCEHLAAACAELADRLLRTAPGPRILATSREVLGVAGEVIWPVPPLATPGPDDDADPASYDAVRLFAERARLAAPGFALDADTAPVVAEICRRLDGLPLAIELAAARAGMLPVAEITARLDDRFRLLTGGPRTAHARQRTLRAAIDWSWDLLSEADRVLLRRLAVFTDGFTVEAAEAVCTGDGLEPDGLLDGLQRLVERSLLVAAGTRMRLLAVLRAYAAERLAEADETGMVEARHTAWFTALAERAGGERPSRRELALLDTEYGNLRAVLDRAEAGGDEWTALRVSGALGWLWATHHHDEGQRRLAAVLDRHPPEGDAGAQAELAGAVHAAAMLAAMAAPNAAAVATARRSVALFERLGNRLGAAHARLWWALSESQLVPGGGEAGRLATEAEAACRELGDGWGEASAWLILGAVRDGTGRLDAAEDYSQRALARFRALDDPWGATQAVFQLGMLARRRGDTAEAVRRYEEARERARRSGPAWVFTACMLELGSLAADMGDLDAAVRLHDQAAELARRNGLQRGLAHVKNESGLVARAAGDFELARRLHGEALAILREFVPFRVPRTLGMLASAETRLGDLDAATAHLREAAGILARTPDAPPGALVLATTASVAAGRGDPEAAAVLVGAAHVLIERRGQDFARLDADEAAHAERAARERLNPAVFAAALERGRGLTASEALAAALGTLDPQEG
jgi:predicted ATPase/DNA-binding SARP family transcriptional activator